MNARIDIPKEEIAAFCQRKEAVALSGKTNLNNLPPLIEQLKAIVGAEEGIYHEQRF